MLQLPDHVESISTLNTTQGIQQAVRGGAAAATRTLCLNPEDHYLEALLQQRFVHPQLVNPCQSTSVLLVQCCSVIVVPHSRLEARNLVAQLLNESRQPLVVFGQPQLVGKLLPYGKHKAEVPAVGRCCCSDAVQAK